MVRLGWILETVASSTGLFSDQSLMRDRLVSLQSVFFMLGYDLRAFFDEGDETADEMPIDRPPPEPNQTGKIEPLANCVPTGFSIETVAGYLGLFLEENSRAPNSRKEFINRQIERCGVCKGTATSNCYPLAVREFNLFNAIPEVCVGFVSGEAAGLAAVMRDRTPLMENRVLVCIIDCYFAGILNDRAPTERIEWLLARGLAGTGPSASTLFAVGRSVGKHFGLFGEGGQPTAAFEQYFSGWPWTEYGDYLPEEE